MLNHELKFDGQYLAKAQALPQNASADGNGGEFHLAELQGAVEIVVKVNAEITLADTKVLSVKLQDKATGGAYADLATIYSKTAAGATTLTADTVLARYILPTATKELLKGVITTTDAAAAGKLDIYPRYLAR